MHMHIHKQTWSNFLRPDNYFSNAGSESYLRLEFRTVKRQKSFPVVHVGSREQMVRHSRLTDMFVFLNHEILYSMPLNHFITTPSLFSSACVSLCLSLSYPSLSCLAYYCLNMCQTLSNPHASLPSPCFSPQRAALLSWDTSNKETENLVLYEIADYVLPQTTHNPLRLTLAHSQSNCWLVCTVPKKLTNKQIN